MGSATRITGMYTGMDTDTLVSDLMKVEKTKVDKVTKQKLTVEYKQEAYRGVIKSMTDFKDKYLNLLNPKSNIGSQSFFGEFGIEQKLGAKTASDYIKVSANGDISKMNQKIDEVKQLARRDTWTGGVTDLKGIKSTGFDLAKLKASGVSFDLSIDKTMKEISISASDFSAIATDSDAINVINNAIASSFGTEYDDIISTDSKGVIELDHSGTDIIITEKATDGLDALGVKTGQSSNDYKNKTVDELFHMTQADLDAMEINGKTGFNIKTTDTFEQMISKIKNSSAEVELTYSKVSDTFELKATKEGAANNITTNAQTDLLFGALGLTGPTAKREQGQNAIFTINGTEVVKSSNNVSIEGLNLELKKTFTNVEGPMTVDVDINEEEIVNKIADFVSDYNKVIKSIHEKTIEEKFMDIKPLTNEERSAMGEEEVKLWDEKAKSGMLRSDNILRGFLSAMRSSLYSETEGVGKRLYEIGIDTMSDKTKPGQLQIDRNKLVSSLKNDYSTVVKLFTNESDESYKSGDRTIRNKENGIAAKLKDVIDDYSRTSRNTAGNKGILVMKAGMKGDASVVDNMLQKQIVSYDQRISALQDFLAEKEDYYYSMFARMESSLSQLNQQMSSALSMLG